MFQHILCFKIVHTRLFNVFNQKTAFLNLITVIDKKKNKKNCILEIIGTLLHNIQF